MPSESTADMQRRLNNEIAELAFNAVFVLTGTTSIGTPEQQRHHLVEHLRRIRSTLEMVRPTKPDPTAVLVRSDTLLTALLQSEPAAVDPALFSDFFAVFELHPPFLEMLEDTRRHLAD
jgi:hypothetical protein